MVVASRFGYFLWMDRLALRTTPFGLSTYKFLGRKSATERPEKMAFGARNNLQFSLALVF